MSTGNQWTAEFLLAHITPVSETWRAGARVHLDSLTKPLGSLGRLEDLAAQLVAIRGERWNDSLRKGVYVFAADHGVTAEGVSAYPREVTRQMVLNLLAGGAAVNVLARLHGAELVVVDGGVAGTFESGAGLVQRKIAQGTRNMRHQPAMSEAELSAALEVGAEMARQAGARDQNVIAVGEMGIGNTAAASAITHALTGTPTAAVTGRGTGLTGEAHAHKIRVVEESVRRHFGAAHAAGLPASPWDVLRCVGGLEIAAMTGMMLEAARLRLVVVIDGFISTAAAAVAVAVAPGLLGYLVAGHCSEEPGHRVLLNHLGLTPLLTLGMRLGEGSGAVLAFSIIESALALYAQMATFASAGVSEAGA